MSIEPEDMLEEALRGDLPTPDAEARVRRRLLAAGVAVGNGVATTTAAAGTGATAVKMAGLSWGLKLGLAAVVAIPTVGLLLDGQAERSREMPVVASARTLDAPIEPLPGTPAANAPGVLAPEAEPPAAQAPERPQARSAKAVVPVAATPGTVTAAPAHPSQADFAVAEPPLHAPRVGSTLAEETRLLDGAFAELAAGNLTRAAALIHEHEARFPAGLLQKERERAKTRLSELPR
jgi:hypothetical protein